MKPWIPKNTLEKENTIMNEQIENYSDQKLKKEMINGKIYLMASPCGEHRDVQGNLLTIFNDYFKKNKRRCRARIDHELYIDERNTLEPDIKILCRETRNDDIPVIVIEILSKSTSDRDFGIKMEKYAEIGIKEYWLISWEMATVTIYLLNDDKRYKHYKSYAYITDEKELKRLDDKELSEIVKKFSPVSFQNLTIQLEDVFYIFE
jgi:Uma2 family endonuclease